MRSKESDLHLAWAAGLDVQAVRELEANQAAKAKEERLKTPPAQRQPLPRSQLPLTAAERTVPLLSVADLAPQQDRNAPLLGRGPRVRRAVFRDASSLPYAQTLSTHLVTERAREVPLCGATRHYVRVPIETPGKVVCAHCRAEASKLDAA